MTTDNLRRLVQQFEQLVQEMEQLKNDMSPAQRQKLREDTSPSLVVKRMEEIFARIENHRIRMGALAEIAQTAGIPQDRRDDFFEGLWKIICNIDRRDFERRSASALPGGEAVFRALREPAFSLKAAVNKLPPTQNSLLQHSIVNTLLRAARTSADEFPKPEILLMHLADPKILVAVLADAVAMFTDTAPYAVAKGKGSGRGRPERSDTNWRPNTLLRTLPRCWTAAAAM